MFSLRNIFCALMGLMLVACGPSAADRDRLERAEAIVRQYPDSALAILDSITPGARGEFGARTTMVEAEAAYRKYQRIECDSVLDGLVDFYSARPESECLLRALYLRGYQHKLAERYSKAIIDYLTAEPIARHLSDSISLGLIYRCLGDVYTHTDDFKSASEAYKTAYHYLKNSPEYGAWAKYDVAKSYYHMDLCDSCLTCVDNTISLAAAARDTSLICFANKLKGSTLVNTKKYAEAIPYYEWIKQNMPELLDENDYLYLGIAYIQTGNDEKAHECEARFREITGQEYSWIDFYNDQKSDDSRKFIIDEYNNQNEYLANLTQQDFHQVIHDYFKLQSDLADMRTDNLRYQRFILLILVSVIISVVLIVFRIRAKKLHQRLAESMAVADELSYRLQSLSSLIDLKSSENDTLRQNLAEHVAVNHELNDRLQHQYSLIDHKDSENDALRRDIQIEFIGQLDFLKNFTENFYECQDNKNMQTKMAKQLVELIDSFRSGNALFRKYEDAINRRFDNIIARLRADVPALHNGEISLYVYYILQFSPRCISLFMDCSITSVYNRKKILKKKIVESGAESTSEYLSFLA